MPQGWNSTLPKSVKYVYDMNTLTSLESTRPSRRLDKIQSVRTIPVKRKRKNLIWILLLLAVFLGYFVAPVRTNILILGTDDSPERGNIGRTDTIILASVVPLKPYIGMLSIPRDLWVQIPGVGEQRINTAYFFAEANQSGAGADAATDTIRQNFNIPVHYYTVVHMSGMVSVVDALGGIDVRFDSPISDFPAGAHHLNGTQVLALARDRSTSDDFSRMARAQVIFSAVIHKLLQPSSWQGMPQFVVALSQTIETNIPIWQLPRLIFTLARAPIFGVDSQTVTREMVTPYVTSEGAQVLLPNWDAIQPVTKKMFGR